MASLFERWLKNPAPLPEPKETVERGPSESEKNYDQARKEAIRLERRSEAVQRVANRRTASWEMLFVRGE